MVLDRILGKLKAQGRRVLVYSQFTTMLDVIQDYCQVTLSTYATHTTCNACYSPLTSSPRTCPSRARLSLILTYIFWLAGWLAGCVCVCVCVCVCGAACGAWLHAA